jgi:Asp-tRNA(Asn)/Glu-tRNA(Gln) amidotransferase A subunit family amidase
MIIDGVYLECVDILPQALTAAIETQLAISNPTAQPVFGTFIDRTPALTVPAELGPAGLPLGAQLVGVRGDDAALLALGEWVEARTGWEAGPPRQA